jgi:hypothetical protein
MARKAAAEKITRINREMFAPVNIERYCRGLDTWPRSWMGMEEDIPQGERLIECFRPFIESLAASGSRAARFRNTWTTCGRSAASSSQN